MNITCNKKSLIDAVAQADKATSRNSPVPALQNVLLKSSKGEFWVTGSNAEIYITSQVDANVSDEFELCVPPATLLSILPNLQQEDITFSIQGDRLDLGVAKIKGLPAEDFPALPIPENKLLEFTPELARVMANWITPFVCREPKLAQSNPQWTGVRVKREKGTLHLMSIAGYEFSLFTTPSEGEDFDLCIPVKIFEETKGTYELWTDWPGTHAIVKCQNQIAGSSLLNEKRFPFLPQFIREFGDLTTAFTIDTAKLLPAAKIALALTDEKHKIDLHILDEELKIEAESQSGQSCHSLACQVRGPALKTGIDGTYLTKILDKLEGEIEIQAVKLETVDEQGNRIPTQPNATQVRMKSEPRFVHGVIPMV